MNASVYLLLSTDGIFPSLESVLLHFLNFTILTLVITFFVYKPVKRGLQKRQDAAKKTIEENATLSREVEKMKAEYQEYASQARDEALAVHQQVMDAAQKQSDEIVKNAHIQAKSVIDEAVKEKERIKDGLGEQIRSEIANVSKEVATSILMRELNQKDNDELIIKSIQSWEENAQKD